MTVETTHLQVRLKIKSDLRDKSVNGHRNIKPRRKYAFGQDVKDPMENIHYMPHATGEDALANRIALELKTLFQEEKLNCIWFHVPNETMVKTKHDFACLKKKQCMGMISGAPDFTFIKNDEPLTLLVELKTDKGKLSHNQKLFKKWAESNGTPYEIARSWSDLKALLTQYELVK